MHSLLESNIRKAIEHLSEKDVIEFQSSEFPFEPAFSVSELDCLQDSYFGFYALPSLVRSLLRSVNFLVMARDAFENKMYAPCVSMAYSAAYQLVAGYLALNGRHWIDDPIMAWHQEDDLEEEFLSSKRKNKRPCIGILTSKNRWTYEPRERSHKARWRELSQVFSCSRSVIPESFHNFFTYEFHTRTLTIDESIADLLDSNDGVPEFRASLDEFLRRIPDARHQSLYSGFGTDHSAWTAYTLGEFVDETVLAERPFAYLNFANKLMEEVSGEIVTLMLSLDLPEELLKMVAICTYLPSPMDEPKFESLPSTTSLENCVKLQDLLNRGTFKS